MVPSGFFQADGGALIDQIQKDSLRINSTSQSQADLDTLVEAIGDARFVLLGEASHGTSEFYTWRARISQQLIQKKGFSFLAVEGDWPDTYRINRFIKGYPNAGQSPYQVLNAFDRWPTWMWANWEIVALIDWLRRYNAQTGRSVGFYGLDVYSLYESMRTIVDYLEKKDPEMARLARKAYNCFEPYAEDTQRYAWSTRMVPDSCENEVVDLLKNIEKRSRRYDGDPEAAFNAEQNALVMVNAERYYRAMVRSDESSWNVRDVHMADTLDRLVEMHGEQAKAIIWAHNTHIGDARYTDMAGAGMVNLGQLVRERHGEDQTSLVGFATHHGTVIAGKEWDAPMEVMGVPDAAENSWEDIFHRAGQRQAALFLRPYRQDPRFTADRGHRAIGVVYNPQFEQFGNYVPTNLPYRYDALIYLDETQALHPLHIQVKEKETAPDTYPWGV